MDNTINFNEFYREHQKVYDEMEEQLRKELKFAPKVPSFIVI